MLQRGTGTGEGAGGLFKVSGATPALIELVIGAWYCRRPHAHTHRLGPDTVGTSGFPFEFETCVSHSLNIVLCFPIVSVSVSFRQHRFDLLFLVKSKEKKKTLNNISPDVVDKATWGLSLSLYLSRSLSLDMCVCVCEMARDRVHIQIAIFKCGTYVVVVYML